MKLRHVIGKGLLALVLCITSMIAVSRDVIAEDVTYPVKGDYITILVDDSEYRVAKQTSDGEHTYLLSSFKLGEKMKYSDNRKNDYEGSVIQAYENGILENLDSKIKNALVEQTNLKQYSYSNVTGDPNGETEFSGQKFVFPLDIKDLNDYAAGTSGSGNISKKMNELFFMNPVTNRTFIWLMSKYKSYSDCAAFYDTTNRIQLDSHTTVASKDQNAHHAFVADLDKLTAKITFDSKGGSAVDEQKVPLWTVNGAEASNYATEPTKPTRDGYEFQYWYLDNEDKAFDFENTEIKDDITLTAKWKKELPKYKVYFKVHGEDYYEPQEVTEGETAVEPEDPTDLEPCEFFVAWLDEEENEFDFSTPITKDTTLTAQLDKYEYVWVNNNVQTWTKGTSTGTIDLEFKRMKDGEPFYDKDSTWSTYKWFDLFFVKDSALDESDYSIGEGSVIVKLNSDYLNSLDAGTYDCSAQFLDEGEATCKFIVKDKVSPSPSPSPKPTVKPTPKPSKVVIQTPVAVPNTDTK